MLPGLQALDASVEDSRIKQTILFNSGYLSSFQRPSLQKLNQTVAYFVGGKKDIAAPNVSVFCEQVSHRDTNKKQGQGDYDALTKVPTLIAQSETGHIGTYYQKYGGSTSRFAVEYFDWKIKGDASKKAQFCGTAPGITKDGIFKVSSKNGICN